MVKAKTVITAILMLAPIFGIAQGLLTDMRKILIRNVVVIDQTKKTEDLTVNILIKQKVLHLISQDEIALKEANIALDAKGGFILGNLEVGKPASFIILNQDPRLNADVILDTKVHAVFAFRNGEVVLNKLIRIDANPKEQVSGWRAYSPPPIALPLSYQNTRKWNVFRTKPITGLLAGAILMENTRWLSQDNSNEDQIGSLDQFIGGSVRGVRLGLGGTFNFNKPWTYVFSFGSRAYERGFEQSSESEFVLYDYRVDIPLGSATLTLGKTRETFSISRLTGLIFLPSQQERASVADGLLPARNIGIVINNSFLKERMTWATGVFNNWYEVDKAFSNNPTVFTGRITAIPYLSEDQSNLIHLGIAGRYSNAAGGIRYSAKTEIFSGPVSVDTDLIDDASSTMHYGLEVAWRKGPFILTSEYIQSNVSSAIHNNPSFKGYYFVASYALTGEMRQYNKRSGLFDKINVANGVNSGGWGALEVYSRWSSLNLNDKNIDGGEMNTFSLGLNWWPLLAIQVNINYRYSSLDRFGKTGSNHGLVTRLVFILE